MKFLLFGYNSEAYRVYEFIKSYASEQDAYNDIDNVDKQYIFTHYVLYGPNHFQPINWRFSWYCYAMFASRLRALNVSFGHPPNLCFTNDNQSFYFQ